MDYVPFPKAGRLWKSKADFFRPFKNVATETGENIVPLYDPQVHYEYDDERDLRDMNASLAVLIDVFPDVQPEVFREMLLSISEESRVEVVTEHLLKKDAKWLRGRYRTAKLERKPKPSTSGVEQINFASEDALAMEDAFRSESYKKAVKQVCYQEFRNLSHSSIKAVLAEHNYSYTLSRPVMQQLTTKSWRFSLSSLWIKRTPSQASVEHPYIVGRNEGPAEQSLVSGLRRTGNAQLDQELWQLLVEPVLARQKRDQLLKDRAYAGQLAEAEAEEVGALFDCECCYGSVSFERIVVCDDGCHQLCFDCVRRTVNEALYGQGWARTADLAKSTVKCFAPTINECQGCIAADRVCHALSEGDESQCSWQEFQARVVNDVLLKSRLRLQRCPSCTYAEADDVPSFRLRDWRATWRHIATYSCAAMQIMFLSLLSAMLIFTVPLLVIATIVWVIFQVVPSAGAVLHASWSRVHKQRRGSKFKCCNPACKETSCVRCTALWRDPHTCFETEKTSLRTAIESSATAAIKRTCPKCLLSFVKSSGCNKLVCNCGYTMCYICRQEITSREGYSHFCQHFRPNGGRCSECERCDLYGDEDEETAIRQAAEAAEKAWRDTNSGKGDPRAAELMVEALVGTARCRRWYEQWLDAIVDAVAA